MDRSMYTQDQKKVAHVFFWIGKQIKIIEMSVFFLFKHDHDTQIILSVWNFYFEKKFHEILGNRKIGFLFIKNHTLSDEIENVTANIRKILKKNKLTMLDAAKEKHKKGIISAEVLKKIQQQDKSTDTDLSN